MVFVKTMKRGAKTYKYWAENERIGNKIKVKLLRPLTEEEIAQLGLGVHVEPIIPRKLLEEKLSPRDKEILSLKAQVAELNIELKLKTKQFNSLDQWILDVDSEKVPNTPPMRPKRFIKEVLTPLLESS